MQAVATKLLNWKKPCKKVRKVDIYDIFFSFNSATLRPESDETLTIIADLLNKHPDWKLAIGGHTDSIASDSFNLDLSNRRAAAVKTALVERFKIADNRLSTQGYGEASPRDTNDTLEGRARNIAWAWQQRKYMADATAVRLTREPDGLSAALSALSHANTSLLSSAWASHLCVVAPQQAAGMIVSVFPSVERRLAALVRMGASKQPVAVPTAAPLWAKLLVGGLLVVMAGLVAVLLPLLVMASTMLTMLFTIMPIAILHALLR